MAELVDASDSKSDSARSAGSIPARGTILKLKGNLGFPPPSKNLKSSPCRHGKRACAPPKPNPSVRARRSAAAVGAKFLRSDTGLPARGRGSQKPGRADLSQACDGRREASFRGGLVARPGEGFTESARGRGGRRARRRLRRVAPRSNPGRTIAAAGHAEGRRNSACRSAQPKRGRPKCRPRSTAPAQRFLVQPANMHPLNNLEASQMHGEPRPPNRDGLGRAESPHLGNRLRGSQQPVHGLRVSVRRLCRKPLRTGASNRPETQASRLAFPPIRNRLTRARVMFMIRSKAATETVLVRSPRTRPDPARALAAAHRSKDDTKKLINGPGPRLPSRKLAARSAGKLANSVVSL